MRKTMTNRTHNAKSIRSQMEAERKLTKIYRRTGAGVRTTFVQMTGTNQLVNITQRTKQSVRSPTRKVVNIQLGSGRPDSAYNKGFGHYGAMARRAGRTAAEMAPLIQNASRRTRILRRLSPWLRATDMLFEFNNWNLERMRRLWKDKFIVPEGGVWICGDSAWPFCARGSYTTPPSTPTLCTLNGQARPNWQQPGRHTLYFGTPQTLNRMTFRGVYSINISPTDPQPPFPPPFVKAPPIFFPSPDPIPYYAASGATQTGFKPVKPPVPPPPIDPKTRDRPPPPRTHERKGQVAAGLGKAVQLAFAASEGIDAVDALWKALPDDIRRKTAKSGVARKGALIGEGTRYSTPMDKFWALYKNYRSLNLSEAAKNLLINHLVDKMIGTMSRDGADKLRKQLGASGWGNVI